MALTVGVLREVLAGVDADGAVLVEVGQGDDGRRLRATVQEATSEESNWVGQPKKNIVLYLTGNPAPEDADED